MKSFIKEFKEFISRGNVIDLAVGIIIGSAFTAIVNSLVKDIIMPAISILTGKVDFSNMVFQIGDVSIKYGNFITTIVDFLIIAFSIFLVVRYLNKLNRLKELGEIAAKIDKKVKRKCKKREDVEVEQEEKEEVVEEIKPETKVCPYCLSEIKYEATRCPHCTSVIEDNMKKEEQMEEKI